MYEKVLVISEHSGQLGHVTEINFINSCPSFLRRLHIKFDFDMQSCFKEKRCVKIRVIYMHLVPGQG